LGQFCVFKDRLFSLGAGAGCRGRGRWQGQMAGCRGSGQMQMQDAGVDAGSWAGVDAGSGAAGRCSGQRQKQR